MDVTLRPASLDISHSSQETPSFAERRLNRQEVSEITEDDDIQENQPLQGLEPRDSPQRSPNPLDRSLGRSKFKIFEKGSSRKEHSQWKTSRIDNQPKLGWDWAFELAAITFSIICFISLVVLLGVSRGKEQRFWLDGHITLNGLVALIATFTRASIMVSVAASISQLKWSRLANDPAGSKLCPLGDIGRYDSASRGPWGSFKLLIKPHRGLAMIGAVITISTLAFDFFAQQVTVVNYKSIPLVNGTVPGDITRSETYNRSDKNGLSIFSILDANATAAIYNAFMSSESIQAPPLQCSTGNCTWPDVSSLAVCGGCTDITETVTYACRDTSGSDWGPYKTCTYHVPEGNYTFSSAMRTDTWGDDYSPALVLYELYWLPEADPNEPGSGGTSPSRVYNDTQVGYIKNFVVVDTTFRTHSQPNVHTCALWWCVQTYRSIVQGGIQSQTIIANYSNADRKFLEEPRTSLYSNLTGFTNDQVNAPAGTNFSYGLGTTRAYEQNPIFQSSTRWPAFPGRSVDQWSYVDDWGRFLIHVTDWHAWIDKVALSMTNNVRATGNSTAPASRFRGQTLSQRAYVRVRWAWLAFPASLIVASIALLLACMWDTRRHDIPVWKDDALALLSCHVESDIDNYFTNAKGSGANLVMLDTSDVIPVIRRPRLWEDGAMTDMS